MRIKIFLTLLLFLSSFYPDLGYADDHEGGGPTPAPQCPAPANLACLEWPNDIVLYWDKAPGTNTYGISGSLPPITVTTKPDLDGPPDEFPPVAVFPSLAPRQYAFNVNITGTNQGCSVPGATRNIVCAATFCGDNLKGYTEACDGTDFGTVPGVSLCVNNGPYESGNLTCTASCTKSYSSCTSCNSIPAITMSNQINDKPIVATGSSFKCFVEASHQGPGVTCEVIDATTTDPRVDPLSYCNFNSWSGNKAEFTCTAPGTPTGLVSPRYALRARYPIGRTPPLSTGLFTGQIHQCLEGGSPFGGPSAVKKLPLNVILPDNTPPQVKVIESSDNPDALLNDFKNVKVKVYCYDGGSGCDSLTLKLKRFTQDPVSCPNDYSLYDLPAPQPTDPQTVWYCAAAKDNMNNIGFSAPRSIRPGCRDQCQRYNDRECIDPTSCEGGRTCYFAASCGNRDTDACLEWNKESQICGTSNPCSLGYCGGGYTGYGYVRGDGNPLAGVHVSFRSIYEGGGADSQSNGQFVFRATVRSGVNISTPATPPGWKPTNNVCQYWDLGPGDPEESLNFTPSAFASSHCLLQDKSASCQLELPFSFYYNDRYCRRYPILGFDFTKTDFNPPSITLSITPFNRVIHTKEKVTFTASASDDTGIKNIEIYVDGALVKRCNISPDITSPKKSGDCTLPAGGPYSVGDHYYYAIVKDTAENTHFDFETFKVEVLAIADCIDLDNPRAEGIVSTPDLTKSNPSSRFGTNVDGKGVCVVNDLDRIPFVSFKIPNYEYLKSRHYTQAKDSPTLPFVKNPSVDTIEDLSPGPIDRISLVGKDQLYHFRKDLVIDNTSDILGDKTGIIFVDGNLNIGPLAGGATQLVYDYPSAGLIFVVQGNVSIDPGINRIDAVIISSGKIFTAGSECETNAVRTSQALTINGALISINKDNQEIITIKKIILCRDLADNATPAELINHQAKYVTILKDLFSENLQKWSEIP